MFACLFACVFVCVRLNNSGTAGPIWLNFFLLAPSWSQSGFRLKKNPDPGSGFSGNPEKTRILVISTENTQISFFMQNK